MRVVHLFNSEETDFRLENNLLCCGKLHLFPKTSFTSSVCGVCVCVYVCVWCVCVCGVCVCV